MSRAHKAAPCALDHDPSLDVTTVEQVAGDHATVAQLLGLDVHGGRVRVTAREWRVVVGIVAWGRVGIATSCPESDEDGGSGRRVGVGDVPEAHSGVQGGVA